MRMRRSSCIGRVRGLSWRMRHVDPAARQDVRAGAPARRSLLAVAAGMLCGLWIVGLAAGAADPRLVEAARSRDWDTVALLLQQDLDVDTPQADSATALHWTAHWNHLEALEALIDAGADVNAENDLGATPLWVACANRNTGIVQRLLAAGANPDGGLHSGETLLMRCTYTGESRGRRGAARAGRRRPRRGAVERSDRLDVGRGHPASGRHARAPRARGRGRRAHGDGSSVPRHGGAQHDEPRGRRALRRRGASRRCCSPRATATPTRRGSCWMPAPDVNDTAADGNSALVLAAMSGHARLAELLLERGADPGAAGAGYSRPARRGAAGGSRAGGGRCWQAGRIRTRGWRRARRFPAGRISSSSRSGRRAPRR